jgi:hypothetical protein
MILELHKKIKERFRNKRESEEDVGVGRVPIRIVDKSFVKMISYGERYRILINQKKIICVDRYNTSLSLSPLQTSLTSSQALEYLNKRGYGFDDGFEFKENITIDVKKCNTLKEEFTLDEVFEKNEASVKLLTMDLKKLENSKKYPISAVLDELSLLPKLPFFFLYRGSEGVKVGVTDNKDTIIVSENTLKQIEIEDDIAMYKYSYVKTLKLGDSAYLGKHLLIFLKNRLIFITTNSNPQFTKSDIEAIDPSTNPLDSLIEKLEITPTYKLEFPPDFVAIAKRLKGSPSSGFTGDIYVSIDKRKIETTNGVGLIADKLEAEKMSGGEVENFLLKKRKLNKDMVGLILESVDKPMVALYKGGNFEKIEGVAKKVNGLPSDKLPKAENLEKIVYDTKGVKKTLRGRSKKPYIALYLDRIAFFDFDDDFYPIRDTFEIETLSTFDYRPPTTPLIFQQKEFKLILETIKSKKFTLRYRDVGYGVARIGEGAIIGMIIPEQAIDILKGKMTRN